MATPNVGPNLLPPNQAPGAGRGLGGVPAMLPVTPPSSTGPTVPVKQQAATGWGASTVTISSATPIRLVPASPNRRSVTVVNQGTVAVYLTPQNSQDIVSSCLIDAGAGRTLNTNADIWLFSPTATSGTPALVDVESEYA